MTVSLAVVCESPADQSTACDLADRVLMDQVDWIVRDVIDDLRQWRGLTNSERCLLWRQVPALALERRIRPRGHFDNRPGGMDAQAARKALLLLLVAGDPADAILLIRDDDNEPARRIGLEQARQAMRPTWKTPVVIGLAHTKRECWVLAGFVPVDQREAEQLQHLRQELGFDPTQKAEQLTAKSAGHAKRDAKRVLKELTQGDHARECRCWLETPLDVLKVAGRDSGLADYLAEIETRIVPLFTGQAHDAR